MTNEQIQALEASALAATTGDWTADDNFGFTIQCYRTGTNRLLATVNGPNAENDMRFISQASPQNILRVLAEQDADKALIAEQAKSIDFLKEQLAQLANFNPDWDKLEAAYDSLREHMTALTAAQKRIAELEARTLTVKLPEPFYPDGDIDYPLVVELDDVKSACAAAGITLVVGE